VFPRSRIGKFADYGINNRECLAIKTGLVNGVLEAHFPCLAQHAASAGGEAVFEQIQGGGAAGVATVGGFEQFDIAGV
jgi:hypothetical protein